MVFNAESDFPFRPRFAPAGFHSRFEAAERLAKALSEYRGKNPLILGIPRGAVPMAKKIADSLQGELDVVLVHKIGAPLNPEFAVGSVSEFGKIYRSESLSESTVPPGYIEKAAQTEIARLKLRRLTYSPVRSPVNPKNRIVIIVDDGIATGSTVLAAIHAIRDQSPQKLIVAAPVGSPRTLDRLQAEVDHLVILETPTEFMSISQFYDEFPQVTDEEVLQALADTKTSPYQPYLAAS
jgi:predicted phosphoribosyltransferase